MRCKKRKFQSRERNVQRRVFKIQVNGPIADLLDERGGCAVAGVSDRDRIRDFANFDAAFASSAGFRHMRRQQATTSAGVGRGAFLSGGTCQHSC